MRGGGGSGLGTVGLPCDTAGTTSWRWVGVGAVGGGEVGWGWGWDWGGACWSGLFFDAAWAAAGSILPVGCWWKGGCVWEAGGPVDRGCVWGAGGLCLGGWCPCTHRCSAGARPLWWGAPGSTCAGWLTPAPSPPAPTDAARAHPHCGGGHRVLPALADAGPPLHPPRHPRQRGGGGGGPGGGLGGGAGGGGGAGADPGERVGVGGSGCTHGQLLHACLTASSSGVWSPVWWRSGCPGEVGGRGPSCPSDPLWLVSQLGAQRA